MQFMAGEALVTINFSEERQILWLMYCVLPHFNLVDMLRPPAKASNTSSPSQLRERSFHSRDPLECKKICSESSQIPATFSLFTDCAVTYSVVRLCDLP